MFTTLLLLLPTTWIVDASNGPGTNFTDLPAAVAAAASGDTIIVRAGVYSHFEGVGKALTILGDGPSTTHVTRPRPINTVTPLHTTVITAVPAGTVFFVSGVEMVPPSVSFSPSFAPEFSSATGIIELVNVWIQGTNNTGGLSVLAGEVRATRSKFVGRHSIGNFNAGPGGPGLYVAAGATFLAVECECRGGGLYSSPNPNFPQQAGPGIVVQGQADLRRTSCFGGSLVIGTGIGGAAITAVGGFVRASGNAATQIQGGYGFPSNLAGVAVSADANSSVILDQTMTIGASVVGPVSYGPTMPFVGVTGTYRPDGSVDATQLSILQVDGQFAAAPMLFAVAAPGQATDLGPSTVGSLLLDASTVSPIAGVLDAAGQSTFPFVAATVLTGLLGVPIHGQAAVLDPTGLLLLSNASVHVYQ